MGWRAAATLAPPASVRAPTPFRGPPLLLHARLSRYLGSQASKHASVNGCAHPRTRFLLLQRRQVALNLVKSLVRLGTSRDRRGSGASNGLGNGSLHSLGPLPEEEQQGEGEEARVGEGEGEGGGDATKGG